MTLSSRPRKKRLSALLLVSLTACGAGPLPSVQGEDASTDSGIVGTDGGHPPSTGTDAAIDATDLDANALDATAADATALDAGLPDARLEDAEAEDAGGDASPADGSIVEAGGDADTLDGAVTSPDAAAISLQVGDGGTVSFDMISAERCTHRLGMFIDCSLPAVTISDPNGQDAGAPVKTTLTAQFSGDCSSAFPLQVNVSATDLPKVIFHFSDGTMDVRRLDRAGIADLTITDDTSLENAAHYADSCHYWVTAQMNQVDPQ